MSYRSLLLPLDAGPHCAARTEIALGLSRRFDARLVGLAPTGRVQLPPMPEAAPTLMEFSAIARHALRDAAERAVQRFEARCREAGVTRFESLVDEAASAESILAQARFSDLVVMTQPDPRAEGHGAARAVVEQVVLESARPTLVVPHAGSFDTIGRRVLVGWDGSREASRALAEALPLLQRAEHVEVAHWRPHVEDEDLRDDDALDALRRWLALHAVEAVPRLQRSAIGVAEAMLSRACDLGADLIVVGAYGRRRWLEHILGGATDGLLASMTVPVLMAH